MVLELGDEEIIRFRQSSSLDKIDGQVLVTNVRVHWTSSGTGEAADFQTPWTNITRVQYCEPAKMNGKAGIKLDLASGIKNSVSFMLTSADRASQLETLKSIVKELYIPVSGAPKAPLNAPSLTNSVISSNLPTEQGGNSSSIGTKRKSAGQTILDKNSDQAQLLMKLSERRAELLAADATLARYHKDLCETRGIGGTPILTEEEFWEAHMPDYANQLFQRDNDDCNQRGRLPLKSRIAAGGSGLKLTRDDILQILEEDPVTRRAHADLVPHQKSEQEFWQLYINKYYHRTERSSQADQLFARYERKPDMLAMQASSSSSAANVSGDSAMHVSSARLTGHWTDLSQFDLLDNLADSDHPERYDNEDRLHHLRDLTHKIIEDSKRIVPTNKACDPSMATENAAAAVRERQHLECITALQNENVPDYAKLELAPVHAATSSSAPTQVPVQKTGFGRASAVARRGGAALPAAELPTSQGLLSGLKSILPTAERAEAFLSTYRRSIQEMENMQPHRWATQQSESAFRERQLDLAAYGLPADPVDAGVEDINASKENASQEWAKELPEAFQQEMKELFSAISEYLRHFYSLLSKDGSDAPKPGNATSDKIEKILQHLHLTSEKLNAKRNRFRTEVGVAPLQRDSMVRVVDEQQKIITRARATWSIVAKRIAAK